MFRNSQRKLAAILNGRTKEQKHIRSGRSDSKTRKSRKLLAEQLEARNLFAGLSFESVITTESNFPVGKSYAFAVASDVSGNTYMGGHFTGTADFDRHNSHSDNRDILTARGYSDAFVAKYDPSGQFLWARRMGGDSLKSSDDTGYGIVTDNEGNVFLTGSFGETADFGESSMVSAGLSDSFLTKLDPNGNFLWITGMGTEAIESSNQIVVDERGSVTVATLTYGAGQPATTRIRQFDQSGTQSWIYEVDNSVTLNGDSSGSIYIAGSFKGTVDLDPGPGQYLVTGSATVNNRFISKLSSDGEFRWGTTLEWDPSINASSSASISGIAIGHDGSIAIIGNYSGQVQIDEGNSTFSLPNAPALRSFFATLDSSSGAVQSTRVYETSFFSNSSIIAIDTGYAVSGETSGSSFNPVPGVSLTGWGSNEVFLMTINETGMVTWAGLIGGASIDSAYKLKPDGKGGLLLPGFSSSSVFDFDPSPLRSNAASNVASFVLQLKPMLPTKFYVVDDAANNRTFEYAADHSSVENYWLGSNGSMAPRGAASTVEGDKVWVVDANKKIYVYNNSGVLLGSWTAGSVASNATIEGITTNGTDIWLVDARQDRVYRYANAATRLSGSQNAASSFALNSGNRDPKDLVTDGSSLWVVNDSTIDKVFKYTMTGALVGSWTIDSANKNPTGLTIDPSGVSQSIWIVDNGTDRVYEYTNSRNRNSGSQSASLSFALAAGNTNPQGIADPPATPIENFESADFSLSESHETKNTFTEDELNWMTYDLALSEVSPRKLNSNLERTIEFALAPVHRGRTEGNRILLPVNDVVLPLAEKTSSRTQSDSAVDEAFANPDLLFDVEKPESLLPSMKIFGKGRRLL